MKLQRLVIVGVGLIGGSLALALKQAGAVAEVVGVGRSQANLAEALRLGVIDRAASLEEAVPGADVVLLATPVAQMESLLRQMAPLLSGNTVITDGGSTKQDVIAAALAAIPEHLPRFVPAHPIAGAEKSGASAASAALYQQRQVVLTPLPQTGVEAVNAVETMWQQTGAQVRQMSPQQHDAIFATVSHLPHLLAYALVSEVASRDNAAELFDFAASGFRDFTRIASSSPEMWRDIALANRTALLTELQAYQRKLAQLEALLEKADGNGLCELFSEAREARDRWLEGKPGLRERK